MLARLASHSHTQPPHFYSSSGGNAGLAAVHAACDLGHPCTVVVPLTTQPRMIAKIREAGAYDVIQTGQSWREADTFLREKLLGKDAGGVHVPPFDHPDIWTGNARLIEELKEQWGDRKPPSAIICSVGGGGLLSGVMQGLKKLNGEWAEIPLIALETKGADSLNASVLADELVTLPGITSQARCLGATRVAQQVFEWATGRRQSGTGAASTTKGTTNIISVVLSDADAAMGCWRLADSERILVELACGVNVAVCFGGRLDRILGRKLGPKDEVVVVCCGGSDCSLEGLMDLKSQFGAEWEVIKTNGST